MIPADPALIQRLTDELYSDLTDEIALDKLVALPHFEVVALDDEDGYATVLAVKIQTTTGDVYLPYDDGNRASSNRMLQVLALMSTTYRGLFLHEAARGRGQVSLKACMAQANQYLKEDPAIRRKHIRERAEEYMRQVLPWFESRAAEEGLRLQYRFEESREHGIHHLIHVTNDDNREGLRVMIQWGARIIEDEEYPETTYTRTLQAPQLPWPWRAFGWCLRKLVARRMAKALSAHADEEPSGERAQKDLRVTLEAYLEVAKLWLRWVGPAREATHKSP
jgi:hypothetical protein